MKKLLLGLAIIVIIFAALSQNKSYSLKNLIKNQASSPLFGQGEKQKVVYEESVITQVVQDSLPSVVTIGIVQSNAGSSDQFNTDPFSPFTPFRQPSKLNVENNIGSGFIISPDGLVITNKHVVSDTTSTYKVLTNDGKKFDVQKIYRDPLNDLAILKISASGLTPLKLGDSAHLKLGQLTIAIGTPLGEFKNTITSGIVSGLGRGITAGSPFEGSVEKLDNVIQTDAAISPGNSGGPLLNSSGQVIGINTAVASEGQNIGFAIPVNIIKGLISKFESNGMSFERPYIGIRYQMIDKQSAILHEVAEGAYVLEVIQGSPAEKAKIQQEDIVTEIDGKKVSTSDQEAITKVISDKKVGDAVLLKVWRVGNFRDVTVTLEASP